MMGSDSVDYHERTVLGRGDDFEGGALAYYGSRGETPLAWGGALADRLGLTGPVDLSGYRAIYGPGGAVDPDLGTRLVVCDVFLCTGSEEFRGGLDINSGNQGICT